MFTKDFYHAPIDTNKKRTAVAVMAIIAVAYTFLLLMPAILGAFVGELGFTGEDAGQIAASNMIGIALSALVAFFCVHRWNLRIVTMVALVCLIGIDLATAFTRDAQLMIVVRLAAGLCTGAIAATTAAVISGTRNPDRLFALGMMSQFLLSAAGFQLIPFLFEGLGGVRELFMLLAAATVLTLPLVRYLGISSLEEGGTKTSSKTIITGVSILALISTIAFFAANAGTWGFAELIGEQAANVSTENISTALSMAMIISILAAGCAAIIGLKFGRILPVTLGVLVMAFSIYSLNSAELTGTSYILCIVGFNSMVSFTAAYYMGFFAWLDPTGRLNAIANFVASLGLALGPLVGGMLIADDGSFAPVINTMAICTLVALVFMLLAFAAAGLKSRKQSAA